MITKSSHHSSNAFAQFKAFEIRKNFHDFKCMLLEWSLNRKRNHIQRRRAKMVKRETLLRSLSCSAEGNVFLLFTSLSLYSIVNENHKLGQLTFLNHPNVVTGGRASARHFKVTFSPSALVMLRLGSSLAKWTETFGGSGNLCKRVQSKRRGDKKSYDYESLWWWKDQIKSEGYEHATLIRLLSSSAPFENQGFVDRHVNSAPSFSAETLSVRMLDVKLASDPSEFTVTSACRMASPSNSHVTFAGGYEPHVSQRIGVGRPAVSNSFGVTIFTLIGFTNDGKETKEKELKKFYWLKESSAALFTRSLLPSFSTVCRGKLLWV